MHQCLLTFIETIEIHFNFGGVHHNEVRISEADSGTGSCKNPENYALPYLSFDSCRFDGTSRLGTLLNAVDLNSRGLVSQQRNRNT